MRRELPQACMSGGRLRAWPKARGSGVAAALRTELRRERRLQQALRLQPRVAGRTRTDSDSEADSELSLRAEGPGMMKLRFIKVTRLISESINLSESAGGSLSVPRLALCPPVRRARWLHRHTQAGLGGADSQLAG